MLTSYIGTGLVKPLRVQNGKTVLNTGKERIQQSIVDILTTPVNTRLMLPEYGSRLHELHFEPNDEVLESLLYQFIFDAVSDWEKRAKLIDIVFTSEEDRIECELHCRILASNEVFSFVFPFYRKLIY